MSDLAETRERPERQLWDVLGQVSAGMLGLSDAGQHMQPMAPQVDEKNRKLWFFTHRDSDLARAVQTPKPAQFCVIGPHHDYHACLTGTLSEHLDRSVRDQFWNSVAAAWFKGGKDDPGLTMLELKLDDAAIWASTRNPITFGWQIAKANIVGGEPEVGARAHVDFKVPMKPSNIARDDAHARQAS